MKSCEQCGSEIVTDSESGGICGACLIGGGLLDDDDDAAEWIEMEPAAKTGEKIASWIVAEKLGEGAFGEVYRVTNEKTKQEGAIKILRPGFQSRHIFGRFESEIKGMEKLSHPNIATVFDSGKTDRDLPWFVMEYSAGLPVTEFCDRENLNIPGRLEIFKIICAALSHAHERDLVHRDLKPSNILVAKLKTGQPEVKLIDFGVAKALTIPLTDESVFTYAGTLIGTPEYMSPEQAAGNSLDLDARADVYSLGVLLYELLTGQTPISREQVLDVNYAQMLKTIRETKAVRPSTHLRRMSESSAVSDEKEILELSQIEPDLDWIVLKALEKDRDRRYESAGDLGADVDRFLNNEPILARRPALSSIFAKWIVGGLTAVAVTIGVLAFSVSKPEIELEANGGVQKNFAVSLAQLCEDVRNDRSDAQLKLRLFKTLATFNFPDRLCDPITFEGEITGLEFVDGTAVVVSSAGEIRLFDAKKGSLLRAVDHEVGLKTLIAYPEKMLAATVDANERPGVIYCNPSGRREISWGWEFEDPVTVVDFNRTSDRVIVGSAAGKMRFQPYGAENAIWVSQISPDEAISTLAVSQDGDWLACGTTSGEVVVINLRYQNLRVTGRIEADVISLHFSPDSKTLAAVSRAGEVAIFTTEKNKPPTILRHPAGEIRAVAKSRTGPEFYIGTAAGEVSKWHANRPLTDDDAPNLPPVFDFASPIAALSHAGNSVVVGLESGDVQLLNMELKDSIPVPLIRGEGGALHFAKISPDGHTVAIGVGKTVQFFYLQPDPSKETPLDLGERCPDWMLELVEARIGLRINAEGKPEVVSYSELETVRRQIREKADSDSSALRWAKALVSQ